jgi:hypothetical protein
MGGDFDGDDGYHHENILCGATRTNGNNILCGINNIARFDPISVSLVGRSHSCSRKAIQTWIHGFNVLKMAWKLMKVEKDLERVLCQTRVLAEAVCQEAICRRQEAVCRTRVLKKNFKSCKRKRLFADTGLITGVITEVQKVVKEISVISYCDVPLCAWSRVLLCDILPSPLIYLCVFLAWEESEANLEEEKCPSCFRGCEHLIPFFPVPKLKARVRSPRRGSDRSPYEVSLV